MDCLQGRKRPQLGFGEGNSTESVGEDGKTTPSCCSRSRPSGWQASDTTSRLSQNTGVYAIMSVMEAQGSSRDQEKRAAFVRLAEKRTLAVLERVRILSNLSNHHVYEFYEEDVTEIFDAIQRELDVAQTKFVARHRRRPEFRLSKKEEEP